MDKYLQINSQSSKSEPHCRQLMRSHCKCLGIYFYFSYYRHICCFRKVAKFTRNYLRNRLIYPRVELVFLQVKRAFGVSLESSLSSVDRSPHTRSQALEIRLREHTLVWKIESVFCISRAY